MPQWIGIAAVLFVPGIGRLTVVSFVRLGQMTAMITVVVLTVLAIIIGIIVANTK